MLCQELINYLLQVNKKTPKINKNNCQASISENQLIILFPELDDVMYYISST